MKTFLTLVCCVLLLAGLGLGAVYFDLIPEPVYIWLDERLGYTQSLAEGGSGSGGYETGEPGYTISGTRMSQEENLAHIMAEAISNLEDSVTVQATVPDAGADPGDYLMALVENAFTILRQKYPRIFWMDMGEYGIQWGAVTELGTVPLTVELKYAYSRQEIRQLESEIDMAVDLIVSGAPDDSYGAVKHFHDWIVNNTIYNTPVAESEVMSGFESAFNVNGVFLEGSAVCEAYAKSFQVLCDAYGIPCYIVLGTSDGESHAWNYVQLRGNWYLVDCTADDPVSSRDVLRWDFFLKGRDGIADGKRIRDIYQENWGAYPELASDDYSGNREEVRQRQASAEEIYRVEMRLSAYLAEGEAAVQDAGVIGTVSAVGSGSSYRYELTGEGTDDARFRLEETSGRLTVEGPPLQAGSYELKVRVSGEDAVAVAVIGFDVDSNAGQGLPEEGAWCQVEPGGIV